ncbi:MAG: pyruvate kinase [Candidatus Omnitrophota bacterium]|nr:pyruvate kinase [Candidatus Omnitrophota bacterium]
MKRRVVKTKIICTIGPASDNYPALRKMMLAGMDVVRLNFSHGNQARHAEVINLIRALNKKYSRRLKILGDLEGYRIRIGKLKDQTPLRKRQKLLLSNDSILCGKGAIPFDYEGPLSDIKNNSLIYIDDGNIALKVKSRSEGCLRTEVIVPGVLKEHKGINIPDIKLKFDGLTDKDKEDIEFSIRNKVDYIAQSFVRSRKDILSFRDSVKDRLPNCKIIAKIENRQGIKNIDEIISVCDGIMVARGDMGVSLPVYEIAVIQKMIIRKCNRMKKFVITATQMLESMTENLRPTRAEVTDVANALLDGSDYLMLSAETAAGRHPVESVNMMNQIIKFTETHAKDISPKHAWNLV